MKSSESIAIATIMIAFSTFLGVLFAGVYYLYIITEVNLVDVILYTMIYIDVNLMVLYIIKRRLNE